jgi:peroxiredoxin
VFPDYSLPDPTGMVRTLSELQGGDPLILLLARGNYCPKEHHQHLELAANYPKVAVAYTRIVTISTDDHHTTQEFRASVGAEWTFLSDTARSTPAGDVVRDTAALTDRPLRRELTEGGAKAGSRLRGPLPLLWQPPEAALPGSRKYGPTPQVSTLTCVSPRTAGDGHPHSTPCCSPALSEALGDGSGRCSGPPLVVP